MQSSGKKDSLPYNQPGQSNFEQATKKRTKKYYFGYMLILPSAIFALAIILIPLLKGISVSLTTEKFDGNGVTFIGIVNYLKILTSDPSFWEAFIRTCVWAICTVVATYCLGLILASALNTNIRGQAFFRSLLLIPWVIPNIVAASIWKWMYHDQFGFINLALKSLGIISKPILWLADPLLAFISVIIVFVWKYLPFMTITLFAGMQSISHDYYEVAKIEGASGFQAFRYITLPLLKPVTYSSTILLSIWAFNHFDILFVLTGGGPSKATTLLPIEIYNKAFFSMDLGYAAAMGTLMSIFLAGFAVLYLKSLNTNK